MLAIRSSWRMLLVVGILVAGSLLPVTADEPAQVQIKFVDKTDDQSAAFEVTGLSPALLSQLAKLEPNDPAFAKVFVLRVADTQADSKLPAISGSCRLDGERLLFVP